MSDRPTPSSRRVDLVGAAYSARAGEYIELIGSIEAAAEQDRSCVLEWAVGLQGPVLDLGCGPGHWTAFLHDHGVDAWGVDPVPEFVDHARQQHPGVDYRLGHVDELDLEPASLGGVLAWFSLIHLEPDVIDAALARIAGWVRPGGGLLVGCFEADVREPFDHAVTTAWRWPIPVLSARIERSRFAVRETHTRTDPGARPQATIVAERLV